MTPLENRPFLLEGNGAAAVLLVHGLGGGTYELQWLGEHLHARLGVTVRAMHLAGHEAPSRFMPASTHEAWLGSAQREYAALAQRFATVHVVGFSTGCLVAMRLAQVHVPARVSGRLALLAPFVDIYRPPFLPFSPERALELVPRLSQVPRRGPPLKNRELKAQVSRVLPFSTMNLDAARSAKALGALVLADLAKLARPTLLVQGARDTVVDPEGAARLDRELSCEHRLVVLEASDHLVALDEQRERVFDEVARFLE